MRLVERLRAVGVTVARGSLLARVAWRSRRAARARTAEGRRRARALLCDLLGEARGLALKAGQVTGLGAGAEPRPLRELFPVLVSGLGRDPGEVFCGIEASGRAASLGQVHRALLNGPWGGGGGRAAAVKVRYPDIGRAVDAELRLAGLMPEAGPVRTWGFDLEGYKRFLRDDLRAELDYGAEAARQEEVRRAVRVRGLVVPETFPDLCGEGVLVQRWEGGEPLEVVPGWPRRDRLEVTRILIETFLTGLFTAGRLHADPNPGNLAVRRGPGDTPEVVLYDYGCVLGLSRPRRRALLGLIVALREGRPVDPVACLSAAGFDPHKLVSLEGRVEPLCRLLLEPFLVDRPFDPDAWRLSERMDSLLGELKWWFRSAGPPDLLLLVRALHGLARQLRTVSAPLPWWPLLVWVVGDGDLDTARREEPPPVPESVAARRSRTGRLEHSARLLKVRVEEDRHEVRSVTLPAFEALDLERLVPEPVRERLAAEGVDLAALSQDLWDEGLQPREVLSAGDRDLSYQVWLE